MKSLLAVFLCLSILKIATCEKCYVCTASEKDQKCGDPFVKTAHTLDTCDNPTDLCLKERLHASEKLGDNVQRACVEEKYCELIDKKSLFCETCKGEGCNSSKMLVPSFIIFAPFILFSLKSLI